MSRVSTTFSIEEVEGLDGKLFKVTGEVKADCYREDEHDMCDHNISRLVVTPQNGGETISCPKCGASGSIVEAGHEPGCNGSCRRCPIEIQTLCDQCDGKGHIEVGPLQYETVDELPFDVEDKARICEAAEDAVWQTLEDRAHRENED